MTLAGYLHRRHIQVLTYISGRLCHIYVGVCACVREATGLQRCSEWAMYGVLECW